MSPEVLPLLAVGLLIGFALVVRLVMQGPTVPDLERSTDRDRPRRSGRRNGRTGP